MIYIHVESTNYHFLHIEIEGKGKSNVNVFMKNSFKYTFSPKPPRRFQMT
uniref:Uncharacterized protein n=1 Tax=Rhizophora mucronata TaxID=61149 RepID=A0A2P2PVA9_RHIMU